MKKSDLGNISRELIREQEEDTSRTVNVLCWIFKIRPEFCDLIKQTGTQANNIFRDRAECLQKEHAKKQEALNKSIDSATTVKDFLKAINNHN